MNGSYKHMLYITRGHELTVLLTPEQEKKVRKALTMPLEKRDALGALVMDDGMYEVIIPFGEIVGLAAPRALKEGVTDGEDKGDAAEA